MKEEKRKCVKSKDAKGRGEKDNDEGKKGENAVIKREKVESIRSKGKKKG